MAVVNLHGINFTLTTTALKKQLQTIARELKKHEGPIIFAGDFNTWSEKRMQLVLDIAKQLKLTAPIFSSDNRYKFFLTKLPLDHVFYRELKLLNANIPITNLLITIH